MPYLQTNEMSPKRKNGDVLRVDEELKQDMNPLSAEFNNRFLVDNVASRKTGGVSSSYVDNSTEFVNLQ